jgi:hypothetical protein
MNTTTSKSLSFQKAAIHCYPALGAAMQILPEAIRGYLLPHAQRDIENLIESRWNSILQALDSRD